MVLRMWTYDLAREQSPTLDHLRKFCDTTLAGGYNAVGLYLEHRFAYPSAPWAHGSNCVTPEMVRQLRREYPSVQIVPFVNLLGHFEGMLYTEEGKRYAEQPFQGMQACPSKPELVELCRSLLDDVIEAFDSEIIHIGGDETWQLGKCALCAERVAQANAYDLPKPIQNPRPADLNQEDGKAVLYGEHFGPLAQYVIARGRRPAVWGDMFLEHPSALNFIPRETLIFDWQYFKSPLDSSREFQEKGFEVVCCPTIQTYNAVWCHLAQSEANVIEAAEAAQALDAYGVCVTTWECALFGNYETLQPAIRGCGRLLASDTTSLLDRYGEESAAHREWAHLMAVDFQELGGSFAATQIRSSLKVRLMLEANPFLAWLYHHEELAGEIGDKALAIAERAIQIAPNASYRGVGEFLKGAVQFVRFANQARQAYANGLPGVATSALAPCRQIFENLEKVARAAHLNIGASLADVERCRIAREHVERVIKRIKEYGDGSLGYLPAFEIITHPKFVPHDQACWWLINRWANE